MEPRRLFVAPADTHTWNAMFESFGKTEADIVRHKTAQGPLNLLELTETELEAALHSKRDQHLCFSTYLWVGGQEPLIPFEVRKGWRQGGRPRDPQVAAMLAALLLLQRRVHASP